MTDIAAFERYLQTIPAEILTDLRRRYAEPQRHYHTWAHIEAMLDHFSGGRDQIAQPDAVLYAILYHDAIYDPRRHDNEALSAALLAEASIDGLAPADRAFALVLIAATAGHHLPEGLTPSQTQDAALFLDMDLSILGADRARFKAYSRQIRAEYAHVDPLRYFFGRRRVLRGFLARQPLFFSAWGRAAFAAAAQANLRRSLKVLPG